MVRTPGSIAEADPQQPAPASSDLAALEAAVDAKRRLLEAAAAQLPDSGPELPSGCTSADLPGLFRRYYWSEPAAEVVRQHPAELAALPLDHLRVAAVRPRGSATVEVTRRDRDDRSRSVVLVITDDMPYL